jgi:hypothetical protein
MQQEQLHFFTKERVEALHHEYKFHRQRQYTSLDNNVVLLA